MPFANALQEMKLVANLEDKHMEMKESQPLTKAIRNLDNILILNALNQNKIEFIQQSRLLI